MLTKTFPLKDAGFEKVAAGDDTLALINQFALRPLSPDEVYVRRMIVANDALDRDNERFSPEVLEHFTRSLPGKSFLVGHQHGSAPIGRFFHAAVLPSSEQPHTDFSPLPQRGRGAGGEGCPSLKSQASSLNLIASFYTIKTKDNEGFRQQIDGGVYSSVSVGFRCEKLVCDICGKDMKSTLCPHYPGKAHNGSTATGTWKGQAEALEASLVYLGAQFGAQFIKSPAPSAVSSEQEPVGADGLVRPRPTRQPAPTAAEPVSAPGADPVIASEAWRSPASGGTELTTHDTTLKSQVRGLEALLEAKERRLDQLSELAEEARTLRSDIISQILSKAHLIGLPSLFNPESLPDLPLSRLKSLLSDLNRQFDRQFPPQGLTTGYRLQAPGSGNTHPRPSTLDSKTDLAPFHLPSGH